MSTFLEKATQAKRESKYVEFKDRFDPDSKEHWCELIKDIVAMANSGGGVILVGVNNDGSPSPHDPQPILEADPAVVADKIRRYVRRDFVGFEAIAIERNGQLAAAIVVESATPPYVFEAPGTYDIGGGKQKTAFGQGTVYFRHGAKSEPGRNEDIESAINRALDHIRKSWLGGVRKVVEAPPGSKVQVVSASTSGRLSSEGAEVRIVDNPDAPEYRIVTPDRDFPFRQKELVARINVLLDGAAHVNSHDLLAVRRVHKLDENPRYVYKSKFGSPQYGEACATWVVESVRRDPRFFETARQRYRDHEY